MTFVYYLPYILVEAEKSTKSLSKKGGKAALEIDIRSPRREHLAVHLEFRNQGNIEMSHGANEPIDLSLIDTANKLI